MEVISTMGGTLSYNDTSHRYTWNGEKVDLSVSAVAAQYAIPFRVSSGWASKVIRIELLKGGNRHRSTQVHRGHSTRGGTRFLK